MASPVESALRRAVADLDALKVRWALIGGPCLIGAPWAAPWNNFSDILIAHQSPSLDTLTTGVGRLISGELGTGTQYPLKLAAAALLTIPVAVVFFIFQRHIMRTNEGALKE